MSPPDLKVSNMLLGKSGGELPIAQSEWNSWAQVDTMLSWCVWWCKKNLMQQRTVLYRKTGYGQAGDGKNVDILRISKLKWTRMGKFNSDDHYIYYCGQQYHRRNRVTLIINKRVWNTVLGCNLKKDRMILVRFQGKPFTIIVIRVYAPTTSGKDGKNTWMNCIKKDLNEPDYYDGVVSHQTFWGVKSVGLKKHCC